MSASNDVQVTEVRVLGGIGGWISEIALLG